ncbi:hypothetical protein [Zavarzinella formosa]|uniref:hypothetical protein n=1 Tax=Zavarzinella formosa TaxID=360055 RepID=UPI00031F50E2|nr:hypothetical protein [Zavarzinella formosa]
MTPVTLTLGGVVFADFEIPDSINSGGEHMLAVHKFPGGGRVIDALGPDDADIRWSGRFRGSDAEERALLLDHMRRQGAQVLLAYSLHRYQVVIREFTANFQFGGLEIPYSLACAVVLDETQALASAAVGFVESLASDLVGATGLSGVIGDSTINAAVGGVATAFGNYQAGVPNTTNALAAGAAVAEGPLLAALQTSITGAQSVTRGVIDTTNSSINTQPAPSGGSPSAMAGAVSSSASAFGQLGNLYQLSALLGRMGVNTANKGS